MDDSAGFLTSVLHQRHTQRLKCFTHVHISNPMTLDMWGEKSDGHTRRHILLKREEFVSPGGNKVVDRYELLELL